MSSILSQFGTSPINPQMTMIQRVDKCDGCRVREQCRGLARLRGRINDVISMRYGEWSNKVLSARNKKWALRRRKKHLAQHAKDVSFLRKWVREIDTVGRYNLLADCLCKQESQ